MNNDLQIADKILAESRVIAVVGISPKPDVPAITLPNIYRNMDTASFRSIRSVQVRTSSGSIATQR